MNSFFDFFNFLRRILHFFCEFLMKFCPDFATNSRRRVTCVAFSINFAKTNQKFAENSEFNYFVKIIHYYSKLFTGVLIPLALPAAIRDFLANVGRCDPEALNEP